jgi:Domain of unknown function DUF11
VPGPAFSGWPVSGSRDVIWVPVDWVTPGTRSALTDEVYGRKQLLPLRCDPHRFPCVSGRGSGRTLHKVVAAVAIASSTLLLVAPAPPSAAGVDLFTRGGPDGGEISSVLWGKQPTEVYAGTGGGLYRSTNGGATWTLVLPKARIIDLAADSTRDTLWAATDRGAFRSADGITWTRKTGNAPTESLAVDPTNPAIVYVGTDGQGLLKSTNNGGFFSAKNTGLPTDVSSLEVRAIAVDPVTPAIVYISAGGVVAVKKIFRSSDGGEHWTEKNTGISAAVPDDIAIDPANTARLWVSTLGEGVFATTTSGDSWAPSTSLNEFAGSNTLAIRTGFVYVGTNGGVQRSPTTSDTFAADGTGLTEPVIDLDLRGTQLLAATPVGVFLTDGSSGDPFTHAAGAGLSATTVPGLVVDANDPRRVLAATDGGLVASDDGGATWRLSASGIPADDRANVRALAADPSSPGLVYAATSGKVFRSSDDGHTWTQVSATGLTEFPFDSHSLAVGGDGAVYVMGFDEFFRSTDGGQTFESRSAGLSNDLAAIAADPHTAGRVFIATFRNGLLRSTNGGGTWNPTSLQAPVEVFSVAVDPGNSNRVYAGVGGRLEPIGLYRSTDNGQTFSFAGEGLQPNHSPSDIVFDPAAPGTIAVSTFGNGSAATDPGGVFLSTDGGARWAQLTQGLQADSFDSLAIGPLGLHVGTFSAGVFDFGFAADLEVDGLRGPGSIHVGQAFVAAFGVRNHGPDAATGSTLTLPLPSSLTAISARATHGKCIRAPNRVRCTFPALDPGDGSTVRVDLLPTSKGKHTLRATVAGAQVDGVSADDAASIVVDVLPASAATELVAALAGDTFTGTVGQQAPVAFALSRQAKVTLVARTAAGVLVARTTSQVDAGRRSLSLDVASAPAGRYSLVLSARSADGQKASDRAHLVLHT